MFERLPVVYREHIVATVSRDEVISLRRHPGGVDAVQDPPAGHLQSLQDEVRIDERWASAEGAEDVMYPLPPEERPHPPCGDAIEHPAFIKGFKIDFHHRMASAAGDIKVVVGRHPHIGIQVHWKLCTATPNPRDFRRGKVDLKDVLARIGRGPVHVVFLLRCKRVGQGVADRLFRVHTAMPHGAGKLDHLGPFERVRFFKIKDRDLSRIRVFGTQVPDEDITSPRVPPDLMGVEESVWAELFGFPQFVHVEAVEVIPHCPDEPLAVRIPEMVRVGTQSVGAVLEVLGRLLRDDLHVSGVRNIEQHDLLAEVSEQTKPMVGCKRDVMGSADTLIVLQIEVPFRPIESQDPRTADQPVQVRTVQCHEGTEAFVVHRPPLFFDIRFLLCGSMYLKC